jgi:putative protease
LLAPAGGEEAAVAAIESGADAVYAGLKKFSARAEAENFDARELEELCAWAHAKGRRVYVTVNTLVREDERGDVAESLETCAACGADAVIVQDAGVARMARRAFPELRLHASTQMAIHNLEGARAAAEAGFSRVTLARELTLEEVRGIAAGCGVEVECFAHGALCYSYSGLCLYSALLRGRSGNRGACAYPCRDVFEGEGGEGCGLCFSMKDLATDGMFGELAGAGVASLKIEGRKKSPLYVAAAVRLYRGVLDGTLRGGALREAERDLKTVFSRPWTALHLKGRRGEAVIDPAATGHRGVSVGRVEASGRRFIQFRPERALEVHDGLQVELEGETRPFGFAVERITLSDGRDAYRAEAGTLLEVPLPTQAPAIREGTKLYLASSQELKRRWRFARLNPHDWRRRLPVRFEGARTDDGGWEVRGVAEDARGGGRFVASRKVEGPLEAPRNRGAMERALGEAFGKLGETSFEASGAEWKGETPFLPVSRLNALRREITDELEAQWEAWRRARAAGAAEERRPEGLGEAPGGASRVMVKTDQPDALREALEGVGDLRIGEVTVEWSPGLREGAVEELRAALGEESPLRLALPPVVRAWERKVAMEWTKAALAAGQTRWEVANAGGLGMLKEAAGEGFAGLDVAGDWPLYVWNRAAAAEWEERGVRRWTCSPEDSMDNVRALAEAMPWRMVWVVHRDPPLFLSENCPHAAREGGCPGPSRCDYEGETLTNRLGETVQVVNRACRFATLAAEPSVHPVPPGLPVLARADFLWRKWSVEELRHALFHVI